MILIRGIKGEGYARKIEKGIVDCRDILSALLEPPVTGYEYSDYYEKNLVKALSYIYGQSSVNLHDPEFLHSLLVDFYIPHVYLTYFHILNKHSIEWIDKFDDDYRFIAVDVKLDWHTKTAIGKEYFGAQMSYVNSICELEQDGYKSYQAACMCSIQDLFPNKKDMSLSIQIYNTLSFALLCRERDEKFTDIENEFRIIAFDCPRAKKGIRSQRPREATLTGKSGLKYNGVLNAGSESIFSSRPYILKNPNKLLHDILVEEQGMVTLDSKFKSISMDDISDDYKYIGGKKECANYIKEVLKCEHEDKYVEKIICRKYKIDELSDATFAPGYQKIEY